MNDQPVQPPARGFSVRALGEVAIRCADLGAMVAFYRDVLGLPPLARREGGIVFFDLGPGHGGHRTVLALFGQDAGRGASGRPAGAPPVAGGRSSLHHLALTVDAAGQQAAMDWYDALGIKYRVEEFDWIGWRGVFTEDPEGNTVELVAKIRQGETHD